METARVVFWVFMLLMDLLIPLVMIIFGRWFSKKPPSKINFTFGYRTTMSMKNQSTWNFAHRYCGKLWFWLGWSLIPLSIIPLCLARDQNIQTIGMVGVIVCFAQLVPLVGSLIATEVALGKAFDQNGKKKS